jgi:aspartate 1-decarboxylase
MDMQIEVARTILYGLKVTKVGKRIQLSLTLDEAIMDAAGLREYEKVVVINCNGGSRLETYVTAGHRGTGICCLSSIVARGFDPGDNLVIMSFGFLDSGSKDVWCCKPTILHVEPGHFAQENV